MQDKYSRVKKSIGKYSKETIVIITGQILIFAASIFGVKILTGVMSPASYGELMLFNTMFIFSSMLLYNPVQQATARYFNTYYHNGREQLNIIESSITKITKRQYLYNIIAIIIFAIFFSVYKGPDAIVGCIFLLIYCISFSQISLYITAFNSIKYRFISSWLPLLEKILKPLCGALLIWYFFDSSNLALAGQAIAGVIVLIVSIILYKKYINRDHLKSKSIVDTSEVDKNFQSFMKSIPIRTFFLWIFLSSDRWVLEFFTSTSEVGLYSALTQIGYSPLTQISSVVGIFISPYIYDSFSVKNGMTERHKNIINKGTIIFLLFSIFIFIMGFYSQGFIFRFIIDKSFSGVSHLLPYVMLSGGLFVTGQFYALKALIRLKPELLIFPSLITSVLGVILYFILGHFYQTSGIVYANLISNFILLVVTIYFCNKGKTEPNMINFQENV